VKSKPLKKIAARASAFARALRLQAQAGKHGGADALRLTRRPVSPGRTPGDLTPFEIERAVNRAVRAGGLLGGLDTCLARAAIRCRLMRERGIDARMVLGIRREEGRLDGHAWVAWPGGPENPPDPSQFASVEIHPSPEEFPGWTPDL